MPKPFLTYDQQIQKLKYKHMVIADEVGAKQLLHRYGYFALISGYKDLLKNPTTKNYRDGTTFDDIVAIFYFDQQLRELTFRYISLVERQIRSLLSYAFCDTYGEDQAAYLTPANYDNSTRKKRKEVNELIQRYLIPLVSKPTQYEYIEHQKRKHHNVPLWALVNAMTFGSLSKMYAFSSSRVQAAVSVEFQNLNEVQLRQLLEVLTDFRNVCAHNERLFTHRCVKHDIPDLLIHKKLAITKRGQEYIYGKRDYFSVVIALRYLLPNNDFLEFKAQLSRLIDKVVASNRQLSIRAFLEIMGFPKNWKKITSFRKI